MRTGRNAFFPKKRESALEKQCRTIALENAFEFIKLTTGDGITDRLLVGEPIAPECVWVELKQEGKPPSPKQLNRHKVLRAMGYDVHVIDNVEDFRKLIKSLV